MLNYVYKVLSRECGEGRMLRTAGEAPLKGTWSWSRHPFLSARRYASAVLAVSVRLTATSRYCIEAAERIWLIFGAVATLGLAYPTPCSKGIRVSAK